MNKTYQVTLVEGHQVASGRASTSPYPAGTIAMQKPFFAELGLDLDSYFDGTLNLKLPVKSLTLRKADVQFKQVHWADGFPAEDFSFIRCVIHHQQKQLNGWIYYPHPETKIQHFQKANIIEVLAPKLEHLCYGQALALSFAAESFDIED